MSLTSVDQFANGWPGTCLERPLGDGAGSPPSVSTFARVGRELEDTARPCPMCGATTWILLDGMSTLQALEGGLQALAFSCDRCGFIRWHRKDKVDAEAS